MSPSINSVDLTFPVEPLSSVFADALTSAPSIHSTAWDSPPVSPPQVVTLKTPRTSPRTFSFTFPESPATALSISPPLRPSATPSSARPLAPSHEPTRIRPPRDVIKLEDRLYYVLQPPLET